MKRMGLVLICGAGSVLGGCMQSPSAGHKAVPDAGAGGAVLEQPADAGPSKPAQGHLPGAQSCVGASDAPAQAGAAGAAGHTAADGGGPGTQSGSGGAGQGGVSLGGQDASVPAPARAGALVITEIMADPRALGDTAGEWFELYNPTRTALALRDCALEDGASKPHALHGNLTIARGAYASLARAVQPGFAPDAVETFSLSNGAGKIALVCAGVVIDAVVYDKQQGFPVGTGASMQLDPAMIDAAANDSPGAWCMATSSYGADFGTPGSANASCNGADAGVVTP